MRAMATTFLQLIAVIASVFLVWATADTLGSGVKGQVWVSWSAKCLVFLGPLSLGLLLPAFIQNRKIGSSVRFVWEILYLFGIVCAVISLYLGFLYVSEFDYRSIPPF